MSSTPWNDDSDYKLAENPPSERVPGPSRSISRAALVFVLVALILVGLGLVVLGFVVSGRLPGASNTAPGAITSAKLGAPAPDFELQDVVTGNAVRLSSLRGKPVWINFWATWCDACKVEMPQMKQAYEQYKAQGLTILGVDVQESPKDVLAYTRNGGYGWNFLIDTDGSLLNRYVVNAIPTHWFVGRDGTLKATSLGAMPEDLLHSNIAKIVGP